MSRPMFRSCSNSGRLATAWARRCRKAPLAVPSAFCRPGSARARAAFSLKAGEVMATTGELLSPPYVASRGPLVRGRWLLLRLDQPLCLLGRGISGIGHLAQLLPGCRHFLLALVLQRDEPVMGAVGRPDQLVEFHVDRLGVAVLGVLDQEDHQEGDDGRAG